MTDPHAPPSLLHVAFPYARNTQQRGRQTQQTAQQAAPIPSLKALSVAALVRNNPRNNDATSPNGTRNNATDFDGDLVQPIRSRLLALAAAERLPAPVVDTIPADELPLYADTDDDSLRWCLHLRARCPLCSGNDRHHDHREAP